MSVALTATRSPVLSQEAVVSPFEIALLLALVIVGPLPFVLDGWVVVDVGVRRAVTMLLEAAVVGLWLTDPSARLPSVRVPQPLVLLAAMWASGALAATLAADHVWPAAIRSLEWTGHVAFGTTVWAYAASGAAQARRVLTAAAAGALALTVYAMGTWVASRISPDGVLRLDQLPPFGSIRFVGFWGLAAALLPLAWALRSEAKRTQIVLGYAASFVGWTAVLWTGGRGSLLALVAGAIVVVLVSRQRLRAGLSILGLGLVSAACSLWVAGPYAELGLRRSLGLGGLASGDVSGYASGRSEQWQAALGAWADSPWLGLGPDASSYVQAPFYGLTHPHNGALQALTEWGLLGAVPFFALALWLGVRCVRAPLAERDAAWHPVRVAAAAYLAAAAVHIVFDGLLDDPPTTLLLAAAAAVLLAPVAAPEASGGRGVRRGLAAIALAVFAGAVLHLAVVRATWAPPPTPEAASVALVRAAPTPASLGGVSEWVHAWKHTDPDAALDLALWGAEHDRFPWRFLSLAGDLHAEAGRPADAERLWRQAAAARRDASAPFGL